VEQAKQPILNSIEMGQPDEATVMAAVRKAGYETDFRQVFGRDVTYEDLATAIAAFETTLVFLDAPFDAWLSGKADAIDASAQRGFELYMGKARCAGCHPIHSSNPLGTDNRFHNIGVAAHNQDFESLAGEALAALALDDSMKTLDELAIGTDLSELGRFMVTRNRADVGAFRTPQLRNVGITGPYMHDGSMQTLWDVMDHYNKGGEVNRWLDGGIEPLALSSAEIDDVVAFLFTLTDRRFEAENTARLDAQHTRAATERPFRDEDVAQRKVLPFERRVTGMGGQ
jgi:cytochrome c peroxidase